MCFLLNLSHCVKSYEHFCQTLTLTMPAHQIWLCHATQDAISKFFYFVLILHLISGKVTKFRVVLQKLSAKTSRGWKHAPPL